MVVAGTQSDDAYAQVKAMVQLKFSPKYLFLSNGANSPTEFPSKVGAGNVNGIFSCGDWFPDSKSSGNPQFVAAYLKKYGGKPRRDRLGLGRGLRRRASWSRRSPPRPRRSTTRRSSSAAPGHVADDRGQPDAGTRTARRRAATLLVEWVDGKLLPVYPQATALHAPTSPKPAWGG